MEDGGRRPHRKLSAEEQARFLDVLRETGNRRAAAEAIGVEARLMDQRREHDAELDRAWEAAAEAAHRRLAGAKGPFDFAQDRPFDPSTGLRTGSAQDRSFDPSTGLRTGAAQDGKLTMIRKGKKGRMQMVAGGVGRWSAEVEKRFKAALRESGNVRAAARAVGFSESAVWERRRKWPAFAEALEAVLEEAELALEFRVASMASNVVGEGCGSDAEDTAETRPSTSLGTGPSTSLGTGPSTSLGTGPSTSLGSNESLSVESACDRPSPSHSLKGRGEEGPVPFDADFAMRFLKWREEKRQGRGRWAPQAKPPSIDEVTETIVRRVEAIKRHRRREAGE